MRTVLFWILKKRFHKAAKRILTHEVPELDAGEILASTRGTYTTIPEANIKTASVSVNALLDFSRLNIALYDVLIANGVSRTRAEQVIEQVNWPIVSTSLTPFARFLKWNGHSPLQVTKTTTELLWSWVFTKPFTVDTVITPQVIAYDVKRCPLQEYYTDHDRANVCHAAVCNQDYRMAALWGVTLTRTQTLCQGDAFCDFRFHED